MKRGTVCQIVNFFSKFSLKLHTQIWKYFHSMVLGSVGRGCYKKSTVLELSAKIFVQVGSGCLGCLWLFLFWYYVYLEVHPVSQRLFIRTSKILMRLDFFFFLKTQSRKMFLLYSYFPLNICLLTAKIVPEVNNSL